MESQQVPIAGRVRPIFHKDYHCPIVSCDGRKFSKFHQYMRHWRKFHTRTSSVLPCTACVDYSSKTRMELREHLCHHHHFTVFAAKRTANGTTRRTLMNPRYMSPGLHIPPIKEEIYTTEETVGVVEVGDNIPRDMDTDMVEQDGKLVIVVENQN
ncbi:unnamed protein product [Mytilus edulis]|uniref:Uncharacterized protein n=1 Tax=Mytilus edulis TaxID=6550 RepID=A0A8S3UY80_MYTED|nr:unnamed protein product [Mytilus edulis]